MTPRASAAALDAGRRKPLQAVVEDGLRRIAEPNQEPPPPDGYETAKPPRQFKLLSAAHLRAMPAMRWLVHSMLPEQGFGAVFGPSGSGKGFVVVMLVAAIAEGAEFFGHRTKQGRVIYVWLEGQAGAPQRVAAWEKDAGREFPASVQFVFESFKLTDRADVQALAAAIEGAGGADVIVIDTLNRAAPEADENSSQDTGRLLEAAKDLQSMVGGFVLFVHHSGKDATKGMRGHSSIGAALDAVIEISRVDDRRELRVQKVKDGEDGETHPFRLRVVDLGEDEDGEPVTSCVVDREQKLEESAPRPKLPRGGNQKIVYDALGPLFRATHAMGKAGAPNGRPCLTLEEAIAGTRARLPVDTDRQTERAREAIKGLVGSGVLGCNEGWVWLK